MRVLFACFGGPGYLFPLVGLALELRRRGHDVTFATDVSASPTLDDAGIERIPRAASEGRSFRVGTWSHPVRTAIDVKHVEHGVDRVAPDVLVTHDLCQASLIVRERRHIPTAVMSFFSYLWPVEPAASVGPFAALEAGRHWRLRDSTRVLNEARAAFRLPPIDATGADAPQLGDVYMLRTEPQLEPDLDALPPRVHAVGPCLWEPPRDDEQEWASLRAELAAPDDAIVYVQQGRTFRGPGFWPPLVEAVADLPVQVVASTGRMDQEIGRLPRNVLIRHHLPQGLVLPRARAAVSCGTSSAVLGALAHGVPHVVHPVGGEAPENAARLLAAGCAIRLPGETVSAAVVRDAIEQALTDDTLRRTCRRVADVVAEGNSFERSAGLIERLGETREPVCREPVAVEVMR